jgi:hypothetical protein
MLRFALIASSALLCLTVASAAQTSVWLALTTWGGEIHLVHNLTGEDRLLHDAGGRASHAAFSNDGRQVAFARFSGAIGVVNNDGTGYRALCNTYGSQEVTNICWTTRGIFWMEGTANGGTPNVNVVDPISGNRRQLTITRNVGLTSLSMSRDGSVGYARLHHESVGFAYGAMFFDVNAGATALSNEKYDDAGEWDHGAAMLNDGSEAVWTLWNCSAFGNPAGPAAGDCYHHAFGFIAPASSSTGAFDKTRYISWDVLHRGADPVVPDNWQLWGPGSSPFTSPANDSFMVYSFQQPVDPWAVRVFLLNVYTNAVQDITPAYWGTEGEFWVGALPDPNATTISQAERRPHAVMSPERASLSIGGMLSPVSGAASAVYTTTGRRIRRCSAVPAPWVVHR